jgi:hypothetical protein
MRLDKLTTLGHCWVFTVILQLGSLDREAWEVISSIRAVRNGRAPVNRLPWDVLALLPDFWDGDEKKEVIITLTHVCRAWRDVFMSRATLWTNFHCADAEKTRVYLERSKSAPINMWLERERGLFPNDPFLDVPSHAIGRLKSLCVRTTPDHLEDITKHFVHSAPLLKTLVIDGGSDFGHLTSPVLTSAFFGGDLSSLRQLCLYSVCTQLPWRNMNNLKSLTLAFVSRSTVSLEEILNFFESAPHLSEVTLFSAAPTLRAQDGRFVSLSHLRRLDISGSQPPSLLLNHLVIPVGAEATISRDPHVSQIDDLLPRSLNNFQNLSNISEIGLEFGSVNTYMRFTGPNGEFCATSRLGPDPTHLVTRALERFDTSSTQCLVIEDDDRITNELHEAIRSMTNLRTLNISRCNDSPSFLLDLYLALDSGGEIACPKLEELVYRVSGVFDVGVLVDFVAARALRGVPLKSVKVVSSEQPVPTEEAAELQEHVSHVEIMFGSNEDDHPREDIDESEHDDDYWIDF